MDIWTAINILLILSGICFVGYGKSIDSSENTEALFYFIFGVLFIFIGILSSLAKYLSG